MDKKAIIVVVITSCVILSCDRDEFEYEPTTLPSDWYIYDIRRSIKDLYHVFFIDTLVGWTVANDFDILMHSYQNGEVFKTFDGGLTWASVAKFDFGIMDIFFVDENNGWLIGEEGRILKSNDGGSNWTLQFNTARGLRSIHFINQNTGWVAGGFGTMYKTIDAGNKWTRVETGMDDWIYDIWFINENYGCFSSVHLYHTANGGLSWKKTEDYMGLIKDLFFVDAYNGWGVGQCGTIIYTNDIGKNWQYQSEFQWKDEDIKVSWLSSVYFIDRNNGLSVGYNYIYSTEDGGKNWKIDSVDQSIFLNDIFFVGNQGWIVGDKGVILKSIQ